MMFHQIPEAVQEYLSAYRYKTELHAHTSPCSVCSELPPGELVGMMKEQGYDAVVITNHFYGDAPYMKDADPIGRYLEDFRIAAEEGKKQGVRVLLGAEYRFDENINDYLLYGVNEDFLRQTVKEFDLGIEAFYRKYHGDSLVILQAHPYRNGMVQVGLEHLDGIEVMNMHPNHNSRVAVAAKSVQGAVAGAEKRPPVVVIGTDLHHQGHEGISALRTKEIPRDEAHLVRILRSGDYIFDVGGYPMLPFLQF